MVLEVVLLVASVLLFLDELILQYWQLVMLVGIWLELKSYYLLWLFLEKE